MNRLAGGQKIVLAKLENYIDQKKEDRKDAWIAFYVVSPTIVELGHNRVYDNNGAPTHPEWKIPDNGDVRILGVVFSHKKWSDNLASKIKSALNDPDYLHFITQLANFADLKADEDTIKKAVAYSEESQNDEPLVALLDEFASRYQFDASRLDRGDPAILRLYQLMRAVTPALMNGDPGDLEPSSRFRRAARSVGSIAGSAAAVGVPFASLLKGLTTLAANVSVPFKKTYDIEPVLIQKEDPDYITLYSLSTTSKPQETVYLGALLTSVEKPQTVEVEPNQHLPIGRDALLHLERSISQLHRAQSWELVNIDTDQTFKQITVSHASLDTLTLIWKRQSSITEVPEPPKDGRYLLEAAWDWDNDKLKTSEFRLHSLESGDVKVHLEPEKPMIAGRDPFALSWRPRISSSSKGWSFSRSPTRDGRRVRFRSYPGNPHPTHPPSDCVPRRTDSSIFGWPIEMRPPASNQNWPSIWIPVSSPQASTSSGSPRPTRQPPTPT